MTRANYTISSTLMQNYQALMPVDYRQGGAVATSSEGSLLFFSIGEDGHVYVFAAQSNTPTGWLRSDLFDGMDGYSTQLIAAMQDETGAPVLAVVLRADASGESSVLFCTDFTAAKGKDRWIFRGTQAGTTITKLAVGHGKRGEALIVVTAQKGAGSSCFLVNPRLDDGSWLWREVPWPIDSQRVLSTAVGHNARLETIPEVDGLLYSLHQTSDGQSWLLVTSMPDFRVYNHAIPLEMNPTAFGIAHNAQGDTELIVADDALYYLSPSLQFSRDKEQVKQGRVRLTPPLAHEAQAIEAGILASGKLDAWFLTQDGLLARTYQGEDGAWLEPLSFQSQVGALHAWKSPSRNINQVFTIDLSNQLRRYRQDPTTTQWKGFDVLVEALDAQREIKTYATQLELSDERGAPLAGQVITIRASELSAITINHSVYYVGPSDSITCQTDTLGRLTLVNEVDGLSTPTLFFKGDILGAQEIAADPAAELRQKLSAISARDLANAQLQTDTIGVTQPLFPGRSAADLAGAQQAVQQLLALSKDLPNQGSVPRPPSPSANSAVLFALDLRGPHPVYVHEAETVERLYLEPARGRVVPAQASFIGSFKHVFGDIWHALEHGFLGAEHFVFKKVDEGIELIISGAEATYQVVVKYAEQVWSVVEYVLHRIGAEIEEIVRWLGFIFAWKDILRTHAVIRTAVNHCADKLTAEIDNAEAHIKRFFEQLKARIPNQGIDQKLGTWADGNIDSLKLTQPKPAFLSSPEVSWAMHHATSKSFFQPHGVEPTSPNASLSDSVAQVLEPLKEQLLSTVQALVERKLTLRQLCGRLLALFEVAVLDTIEVGALAAAEAVKLVIGTLKKLLDTRWKIPFFSPLYSLLTGGSPLTLLDLVSLVLAIPSTLIYKISTGHAPFNHESANRLSQTADFDGFVRAALDLDPRAPQSLWQANDSALEIPEGARIVSYVLGLAISAAWVLYGCANILELGASSPSALYPIDSGKLVLGFAVNSLSIVAMYLAVYYTERNIPVGSKRYVDRVTYEATVTAYQLAFNLKDLLMVEMRAGFDKVLDGAEAVMGGINFLLLAGLASWEFVDDQPLVATLIKTTQNMGLGLSQLAAPLPEWAKDTELEPVALVVAISLNIAPPLVNFLRTYIAIIKDTEVQVTL